MPQEGIQIAGLDIEGKTAFPILVSLSLLIVFVLSPSLGARADRSSQRKKFLMFFCALGSLSTMGLIFTSQGQIVLGSLLFMGGMIGFSFGNVFYNSLIKDVASEDRTAQVSARGWALGYAGGFTALVLHMVLIQMHAQFGLDKSLATKIALASTGLWWLLFAIPLFLNVQEQKHSDGDSEVLTEGVGSPWSGVFQAIREVKAVPFLGVFLMAFFLYNDAVQTTISQATNLANELLGMELTQVLQAGMMIQFVAIFGSLLFLFLEKKFSTKTAVLIALVNWCFILIWALLMQTPGEFYILCAWVGLVLGITQSGSRTLFANQIPASKSAQLFSFYTLADRASAVIGPLLFAVSTVIFPIRYAIVPMLMMLVLGTLWLYKIPVKESTSVK